MRASAAMDMACRVGKERLSDAFFIGAHIQIIAFPQADSRAARF